LLIGTYKVFIFTSIFKHYYNFSPNFSKAAKFNENLPKLRLTSKLSIRVLSVKKLMEGTEKRRKMKHLFAGSTSLTP
jgi:hypothetical protein